MTGELHHRKDHELLQELLNSGGGAAPVIGDMFYGQAGGGLGANGEHSYVTWGAGGYTLDEGSWLNPSTYESDWVASASPLAEHSTFLLPAGMYVAHFSLHVGPDPSPVPTPTMFSVFAYMDSVDDRLNDGEEFDPFIWNAGPLGAVAQAWDADSAVPYFGTQPFLVTADQEPYVHAVLLQNNWDVDVTFTLKMMLVRR